MKEQDFSQLDWDVVNDKIRKVNNKSLISVGTSIFAILLMFILPLGFLPRNYSLPREAKMQTMFEWSPVFTFLLIAGFALFEIYYILIYLKRTKLYSDCSRGTKYVEEAIIVDYYDYKDLDGDRIQVVINLNDKTLKSNFTKSEFKELGDIHRNQIVMLEYLPETELILKVIPIYESQ